MTWFDSTRGHHRGSMPGPERSTGETVVQASAWMDWGASVTLVFVLVVVLVDLPLSVWHWLIRDPSAPNTFGRFGDWVMLQYMLIGITIGILVGYSLAYPLAALLRRSVPPTMWWRVPSLAFLSAVTLPMLLAVLAGRSRNVSAILFLSPGPVMFVATLLWTWWERSRSTA